MIFILFIYLLIIFSFFLWFLSTSVRPRNNIETNQNLNPQSSLQSGEPSTDNLHLADNDLLVNQQF